MIFIRDEKTINNSAIIGSNIPPLNERGRVKKDDYFQTSITLRIGSRTVIDEVVFAALENGMSAEGTTPAEQFRNAKGTIMGGLNKLGIYVENCGDHDHLWGAKQYFPNVQVFREAAREYLFSSTGLQVFSDSSHTPNRTF